MKLAYLVPAPIRRSMGPDEVERRQAFLRRWAAPGTEIDLVEADEGPASIESALEEYISVFGAAKEVERLEAAGYDGAVLGCAGDPGLDALREVANTLVMVGPGAAGFLTAASLGRRFSVLTPSQGTVGPAYDQVLLSGLGAKLASVRSVDIPVLAIRDDPEVTMARAEAAARKALEEDGADVLVLGCMSLAFLSVDQELSRRVDAPVVNPVVSSLKMLEGLVAAGLRPSKRAYPRPAKLVSGSGGVDSLLLRPERGAVSNG